MSTTSSSLPMGMLPARGDRPWLWVGTGVLLLCVIFHQALLELWRLWMSVEEYSHGVIVPGIAAYLFWQRRESLARLQSRGSWTGVGLVAAGLCVGVAGSYAAMGTLTTYGFLIALWGIFIAVLGVPALRLVWAPLAMLFFMIPLPQFLYNNLSLELQLISSQIGVWFIRLFGISVHLEGNVIDLGAYQLEVAEACNGLRYLFPLMTLGFLMALFFRGAMWKRIVLFVSSVPITVLLNSLRVGTIGWMVEHWGTAAAEGFVHDFQGWAVFMVSAALMLVEMLLLARLGGGRQRLNDVLVVAAPQWQAGTETTASSRRSVMPTYLAAAMLVAAGVAVIGVPGRAELVPARESLVTFPDTLGRWSGRRTAMEQVYLDVLKPDDYLLSDYQAAGTAPINFHIAWFASQRDGQTTVHSPRTCIPGGGWRITELTQADVPQASSGPPLRVNRVLIQLGNQRQLVYYWFQQRGRVITNEYMVKWYLFWDSLTRRRSDGAMVRLVTPLATGEEPQAADARLAEMATQVAQRLNRYVPD